MVPDCNTNFRNGFAALDNPYKVILEDSLVFFTTKLTTSSVTYRAVVNSILRQNGTSYRIFVLLSMVAQYIHVLPAKRIDNKMKGWTDRTKRRTHRQSDKQTDILYDHRTI